MATTPPRLSDDERIARLMAVVTPLGYSSALALVEAQSGLLAEARLSDAAKAEVARLEAENARLEAGNKALAEQMHENGTARNEARAERDALAAVIEAVRRWATNGRGEYLDDAESRELSGILAPVPTGSILAAHDVALIESLANGMERWSFESFGVVLPDHYGPIDWLREQAAQRKAVGK